MVLDVTDNFAICLKKIVEKDCCNISMYNFQVNNKIRNFMELINSDSLNSLAFLDYCKGYICDKHINLSAKSILNLAVVFTNFFDNINIVKENNLKFYLSFLIMLSEKSDLDDMGCEAINEIGEMLFNNEAIEFIRDLREEFKVDDIYLDKDYYEFLRDLVIGLECKYYISKKNNAGVPNVCDYVNNDIRKSGRVFSRQHKNYNM